MKKIFFAIVLTAVFAVGANARQGSKQISAGVELAIPAGTFGDIAKTGFGINGKAIFGISENGNITATTELANFGYKGYRSSGATVIPILGGYRHNFAGAVKGLYAEPQIDAGIYLSKFGNGDYKLSDSEVDFTWALGGGAGFFALKAAYNLPLAGK